MLLMKQAPTRKTAAAATAAAGVPFSLSSPGVQMDAMDAELAEEAAEAEGPLRAALQYAVGEIVRAEGQCDIPRMPLSMLASLKA